LKRRIVADSICADVWVATEPSSSASATPEAGTGEYGARMLKDVDGAFDVAVRPFGEWAHIKPTWIGKAGERDIKAIASYLNRRIWRPSADVEIFVQELRSQRQEHWPRNLADPGPLKVAAKSTVAGTAAR
jgi:hypothetical protein